MAITSGARRGAKIRMLELERIERMREAGDVEAADNLAAVVADRDQKPLGWALYGRAVLRAELAEQAAGIFPGLSSAQGAEVADATLDLRDGEAAASARDVALRLARGNEAFASGLWSWMTAAAFGNRRRSHR